MAGCGLSGDAAAASSPSCAFSFAATAAAPWEAPFGSHQVKRSGRLLPRGEQTGGPGRRCLDGCCRWAGGGRSRHAAPGAFGSGRREPPGEQLQRAAQEGRQARTPCSAPGRMLVPCRLPMGRGERGA